MKVRLIPSDASTSVEWACFSLKGKPILQEIIAMFTRLYYEALGNQNNDPFVYEYSIIRHQNSRMRVSQYPLKSKRHLIHDARPRRFQP